ncbi:hypothetical protein VNO77_33075 [Canavalia gladiata]|uniref:Zinc finger protein CONSTANS-LIKE 16 n=1 Tax=Canavalia gladiata TaxID=3824 RepID=A0AAN9KCP6_CANGL
MKAASALGGRTARPCDSCLKVRARWYCAADDAFLCHGCDNMVHSANQLASRHERVRLQTASSKVAWHSGFTRKARTPRHNNKHLLMRQQQQQQQQQQQLLHKEEVFFNSTITLPLVPELGSEESLLNDETEEQLLCRVPVFDAELYNEVKDERLDMDTTMNNDAVAGDEAFDLDNFPSEFLPSDMDLAEFAADVESLLGNGVEEDSSGQVKESFDCKESYVNGLGGKGAMIKVKDEEELPDADTACHLDSILDMNSDAFNWNVIDASESPAQEEEEKDVSKVGTNKKEIFLRLNYEEVITAWSSQGSPWTTGTPPKFNSDDCWPDFLGSSGAEVQWSYGEVRGLLRGHADEGREARVSRYREKRRTRLFAKKIRYEVRKLNAEKRPRMKGRFVKRTSFVGATAL